MKRPRRIMLVSLAVGGLLLTTPPWAVTHAAVPPDPTMTVTIGNEQFQATPQWNYDAAQDQFSLASPLTFTHSSGSTLTISQAGAIPDPVLFFSANATNTTANPLAYSFAFNTPLVPTLLGHVDSHAELGVTLTDGSTNGATVQPTNPAGKLLTSFDLYGSGTPISKNVDIGNLFSIVSGTGTTSFAADGDLTCGQPCVTMSALLSFTLTGNDSAGFSGKVVQSPAPVPAAVWLFGSGLVSLAGLARRRLTASAWH